MDLSTTILWIIAIGTFVSIVASLGTYFVISRLHRKLTKEILSSPFSNPLLPKSMFLTVDGARVHYVQAGTGPDVVFLHGIGASVFVWRFIFPLLQGRYRLTAIDLPGFGQSCKEAHRDYGLDAQAKVVADTLTALEIDRAFLVGSSMGGAIALWLGKLYPSRFVRIATLAPATDPKRVPVHARHFASAAPYLRRALNRRTMKLLIRGVVTNKELITDEVTDAYLRPFLEERGGTVRAFWSATTLLSDPRLPKELTGLSVPTLVVYPKRDLMVSRRSIDRLMRVIPSATLEIHQHGGHHIMEDEPEWTAETLARFFNIEKP